MYLCVLIVFHKMILPTTNINWDRAENDQELVNVYEHKIHTCIYIYDVLLITHHILSFNLR